MAHHRKRRHVKVALIVLAVLAVVGVGAATTVFVIRSQAGQCGGQLTVGVIAAPAVAPTVTTIANQFNGTDPVVDNQCVHVNVTSESSAEAANELPTEQIDPPAIWIPDSSLWARAVGAQASTLGAFAPKLRIGASLASTPLVLAAPQSLAHSIGWPAVKPSWRALAAGALPGVIGNPTTTTEGLASVLMLESVLGEPMNTPSTPLAGLLVKLGRLVVADIADQFTSDTGSHPHVFTASEQAVNQANQRDGEPKFVAMTPQEGTFLFDYPVVTVGSRSDATGTADAVARFENALRTSQTSAMLTGEGFGAANTDGANTDGANAMPATAAITTLLRTWIAVNLDTRFLAVIDVSGSMGEAVSPGGETKAEIVRDATNVGLAQFPDSSEIGLWDFSNQLAPPNDWQEVVPIGPLGSPVNGVTRRVALQQATAALPSVVHGATALYSTTIAAYQDVLRGYDPTKVDAVVLMTDGANATDHGPDLPTTVSELRALANPARPLPLIAIGIGPAADMDALNQMAAVTNGKAYQVNTAQDIVSVFLDALVRRTCESGCG
jgi:Ca-activated chloride channel family protein